MSIHPAYFHVGRWYDSNDRSYDPVKVIKRTVKYIRVRNTCGNEWRMLIRVDIDGNEYAIDRSVPSHWRYAFTYCAENETKGWD